MEIPAVGRSGFPHELIYQLYPIAGHVETLFLLPSA